MKCAKCGADLGENTQFCGVCGNPVEPQQPVEPAQPTEPVAEQPAEPVVEQPVQPVQPEVTFSSEVSSQQQPARQEIVTQPLPFDTQEFKTTQEKSKKNSKAVKTILIVLFTLIVIGALVFAYFRFFKKESYSKSIDSMEKAMKNMSSKGNNSGTVVATVKMKSASAEMNISASIKYQKTSDSYKLEIATSDAGIIPKMSAYVELTDTTATIYIPGTLISYLDSSLSSYGSMFDGSWFKYQTSLKSLGIDSLKDLEAESTSEDIDLTQVLPEGSFKYVDRKNGLKHYTLTVDDKFISSVIGNASLPTSEMPSLGGKKFNIEIYLSTSNELRKIEIDFKDILKDQLDFAEIDSLLLIVEFKDLNDTTVIIPNEVKTGSYDISGIIGDYSLDDDDDDYDYDYDDWDAEDIFYDAMLSAGIESCYTERIIDFANYNNELYLDDDYYDVKRITAGKIRIYEASDGSCAIELVSPLIIDGKTCVKDTNSYSKYEGICK